MNSDELSARQEQAFANLKEEFSRLEQQEKSLRKSVGLPEEGGVDVNEADLPPDVKQELEEAKAKAKREGAARAAQYQAETSSKGAASVPGGRRQGVMRI
ncbi:MAG: hypothetical protein K6G15_06205 [Desulfovibrio sp.]|nr:hypothetical protein [Desulfovibrio sp.]